MNKQEIRKKQTRQKILQTFSKLVLEKRYENITISLLCKEAKISRNTFYEYYDHLYSCVEELLWMFIKQLEQLYDVDKHYTKKEFLFIFFQYVNEHQKGFQILASLPLSKDLAFQIMSLVTKYCSIENIDNDQTVNHLWYAYQYMGIYGLLHEWVRQGCQIEIEQLIELID